MSAVSIPTQFFGFTTPKRAFVLHNARKIPVDCYYVGNKFTLPPVGRLHESSPETDADGDPIPGSLLIEDLYMDEVMTLDSRRAVIHILGLLEHKDVDGKVTAEATSPYALSGISLLPRHPTKEHWKAVAVAGDKRSFLKEVDDAQKFVDTIIKRNQELRQAGMDLIHGGLEFERSKKLLEAYSHLMSAEAETEIAPHLADKLDEDVELSAIVHAKAQQLADETDPENKTLDRKRLFEELVRDPKLMQWARKEGYRIRKKGHQAPSAATLREFVEAGEQLPADDLGADAT